MEVSILSISFPDIFFLSLVATDANDEKGEGIPRIPLHLFDVQSEIELQPKGIRVLSAQDLKSFQ